MKILNDVDVEKQKIKKKKVSALARDKSNALWIGRITLLAFSSSLLLSIFSESLLNKSSIIIAIVLLVVFMMLNVFSDMVGLAITSCQIEKMQREVKDESLLNRCLILIKNADKVSSVLCDVVGDISGILCGVSGTMIAMLLSQKINILSLNIFFGAFVSSVIAGLTVLFKAISKNFAVNHSLSIVVKSAKFLQTLSKFFSKFIKKRRKV